MPILSTAYLPPVAFFSILASDSLLVPGSATASDSMLASAAVSGPDSVGAVVELEACEHYRKQTWRNRCRILTASGPMDLRVPVLHDGHRRITEVRVDYTTPWVRQTRYAIETAYDSSPFFIYYKDALFDLLEAQPERLWDLNLSLIRFFCEKLGLSVQLRPTLDFVPPAANGPAAGDWREALHPKRPCDIPAKPYWQVFRDRFCFVPGLSILDLLCNEGPEAAAYL